MTGKVLIASDLLGRLIKLMIDKVSTELPKNRVTTKRFLSH